MAKKKKQKEKKYRYAVFAAGTVAALLILTAALLLGTQQERGVVCQIDGIPVYEPEVAIAADQVEFAAKQQFAELAGKEMGSVDLSEEVDGKTGYEFLGEAVKDELVRMKTIQIDAKRHGLCEEITYPEIEKAREEENSQRADTKASDGVVYGVVSFGEEEYYRYLLDNLDLQNKRYLRQEGVLTATEEEAKEEYKKDPSVFDNQEYDSVSMFVKNAVISRKYEEYMDQLENSAEVENAGNIARFLERAEEQG